MFVPPVAGCIIKPVTIEPYSRVLTFRPIVSAATSRHVHMVPSGIFPVMPQTYNLSKTGGVPFADRWCAGACFRPI
jgi:hypothetical protein